MTTNEVKKAIYKTNPTAVFEYYRKGNLYYTATMSGYNGHLTFVVPISDAGDADFSKEMDAKLLIRYMRSGAAI